MGFEPQKFFIGVIDFFSILLPGAVLALGLYLSAGPQIFRVFGHIPRCHLPRARLGWPTCSVVTCSATFFFSSAHGSTT